MIRLIAAAAVLAALPASATEVEVAQKNKKFSTTAVKAKVGDTLVFRNDDPFFHNIFSLSDTQSFDLGSYPQGESRKVVLKKEGTLEIECAIHPDMKLKVQVEK
ncbi:methylamine utilization protein [Betaproteobacteria bacterium GR16-43]|nr:methylamine utilization protein [Betaproteobacteria bacterium GR16-43]